MSVHFAFCGLYIDGEREVESEGFEHKHPIFGLNLIFMSLSFGEICVIFSQELIWERGKSDVLSDSLIFEVY